MKSAKNLLLNNEQKHPFPDYQSSHTPSTDTENIISSSIIIIILSYPLEIRDEKSRLNSTSFKNISSLKQKSHS